MVKMARTALGAKTLLGLNLEKLSSSSIEKIERYISSIESDPDYDDRWFDLRMLDDDAEAAPSRKKRVPVFRYGESSIACRNLGRKMQQAL